MGAMAISDLETGDGVELDAVFDPVLHRLTVSLDKVVAANAKTSARGNAKWTIVTEWDWDYTPLSDEKILPMPFYKQSGG
jgi:hypothetical protein